VKQPENPSRFLQCRRAWRRFTQWIHYGISLFVLTISLKAARNPKSTLVLVMLFSFAVLLIGLFTNFYVEVSEEELFSPQGSAAREHKAYLTNLPGYPDRPRMLFIMVHNQGENVLEYQAVDRLFHVLDTLRMLEDYDTICSQSSYVDHVSGENTCKFVLGGPTRFWNDNSTLFRESTKGSDELTRLTMSNTTFPGGSPVASEFFLGHLQKDNNTGVVAHAQSLVLGVELPPIGEDGLVTAEFEWDAITALLKIRKEWEMETSHTYRLEFSALRTFPDETERAILNDIPLIPMVFVIMTLFTMFIFWRRDKVQSRTMLGVGSVVTILMSVMTGYGLAFIIGIPFTSMTQILPFVVFGVGLDDTFIITGAYFRTDPRKDTVERVRETMEEVGSSISLTTITTTVAFLLGVISTIPCIRWLCFYAAPTIFFDFIYQITFFIAILVIDEERMQENRRDCCIWISVEGQEDDTIDTDRPSRPRSKTEDDDSDESAVQQLQQTIGNDNGSFKKEPKASLADRAMDWYADQILKPKVKIFVLSAFTVFLAGCAYSATLLTQEFKAADFLPDDSYAASFLVASETYVSSTFRLPAVFRGIDQSDPEMQRQMMSFVEDLGNLTQFEDEPDFCWIRDFQKVKNGEVEAFADYAFVFNNEERTFNEQLDIILGFREVGDIYGDDIARDEEGNIESSRCWLTVSKLDLNNVEEQLNMMRDIQRVMHDHPMNQGRDQLAFFIYDQIFFLWQFYVLAVEELWATTISGIVAITVIGFVLIPHWSATLFVTPLICVLYVDLLGTIQFAGLHINPLTYVCMVVSIGLLVDFLMHIILRYFESSEPTRDLKVKDTLRTMGASILVGGLSTCLGVVPLAFSTSGLLKTVFICFISMVSLGVGHGLILLPVLLSYFGPEVCVRMNHQHLAGKLPEDSAHNNNTPSGTVQKKKSSPNQSQTDGLEDTEVGPPFKGSCSTNPHLGMLNRPPLLNIIESGTAIDVDNLEPVQCPPILTSVDITNPAPVSPYSAGEQNEIPPTFIREPPNDIDPRELGIFRTNSSGSIEV